MKSSSLTIVRTLGLLSLSAVALTSVLAISGCRGERTAERPRQFFPDMDDQPKYKAQSKSTFFKEYADEDQQAFGRSMREPVVNTVAFGRKAFDDSMEGIDFAKRNDYLKDDDAFYRGALPVLDADGNPVLDENGTPREVYVQRIPIPVNEQLLALGQQKFDIFCIVCHGGSGAGDGMVGRKWSYPLPSWHTEQYQRGGEKGQDGYLFHTIRNGVPNVGASSPYPYKMLGYASKVSEHEAWAIVAYIRALQMSQGAPINALSESERSQLRRPAPAPAATKEGGAS